MSYKSTTTMKSCPFAVSPNILE